MADIRSFEHTTPETDPECYLDPGCVLIGDVRIGARSSVWPGVVIRGDVNRIRIGEGTNVQDNAVLHNSHDSEFLPGGSALIIGDDVTVGHGAILHGCTIGNQCLIGMRAVILDGTVVEDRVMLGANSLVTGGKRLQSGYLYAGSPAKQLRPLTDDELRYLKYSAEHYVRLAQRHKMAS